MISRPITTLFCSSIFVRHGLPSSSAAVSEAAAVGRSVVKVRATDQDTGPNAEITYMIISGDDQGKNLSREVSLCARTICNDVTQSTRSLFGI